MKKTEKHKLENLKKQLRDIQLEILKIEKNISLDQLAEHQRTLLIFEHHRNDHDYDPSRPPRFQIEGLS